MGGNNPRKGKRKRFKKQSFKRLLKESIDTGVPFNDTEFKAEDESVALTTGFKSKLNVGRIVWKRPRELSDDPHLLFREKLGPATNVEFVGFGPNEWLLAAASAIAQEKALVYRVIPKEQFHFLNGIFKMCFWRFGTWVKVVIDDKLPTFDNNLIFSCSSSGSLFWVPLLEKAYAKILGNYERMAHLGNLGNALTDFTGSPVEQIDIHNNDDEKDYFRLIAEELDHKALICVKTRDDSLPGNNGLKSGRIYIINGVKKPSTGSFKKIMKESNAMIRLVTTFYDKQSEPKPNEKIHDFWLSIENFTKYFDSLSVCHLNLEQNKRLTARFGSTSTQFCFEVYQDSEEVMIDLMQKTADEPKKLGFQIFKVEMNRRYRIHKFPQDMTCYTCDGFKTRSVFRRIKLSYGRYIVVPVYAEKESNLLLRLYSLRDSNLRVLTRDMPRNLMSFISPKYPKYVSRVIVKGAHGLEKQDRFGSANPYCVIRCGRKAIKSHPIHDALNPDWNDFSAIFYHGKFVTLVVEIWHHSLLIDSFMGQVEVLPKLKPEDITSVQELDLSGRKKGHSRPGTIKLIIKTSEDLREF